MSSVPLFVVALGGNAIQDPAGDDTVASDFARTTATAQHLVDLIERERCRLVVTHGNGPQVGNHLYRSEVAHETGDLPLLPLDVCVADTQGGMGYMLQQCLTNVLHARGHPAVVASLVTQVVVDPEDPAFDKPAKPVGEMIPAPRAALLRRRGWVLAEDDRRRGWRRVVASPDPQEVVEAEAVRALTAAGIVTVAGGGGGIPVAQGADGALQGVHAVVDKDLVAALLAVDLGADLLLILTDVERVSLRFGRPDEEPLDALPVAQARRYLAEGEFPAGSMGPKVEAACRFVEATGRRAVITSIDGVGGAARGGSGTTIART